MTFFLVCLHRVQSVTSSFTSNAVAQEIINRNKHKVQKKKFVSVPFPFNNNNKLYCTRKTKIIRGKTDFNKLKLLLIGAKQRGGLSSDHSFT